MGATAPLWVVAIGSALVILIGIAVVVALCLRALREGVDFDGGIKAASFSLHIRMNKHEPNSPGSAEGHSAPDCSAKRE